MKRKIDYILLALLILSLGPSAIAFAVRHPDRTVALIALEAISQSKELDFEVPCFMRSDFLSWAAFSVMSKVMAPEDMVKMMVSDQNSTDLVKRPGQARPGEVHDDVNDVGQLARFATAGRTG